jgi:hypothetical protein
LQPPCLQPGRQSAAILMTRDEAGPGEQRWFPGIGLDEKRRRG